MRFIAIALFLFCVLNLNAQTRNDYYKKASEYYDKTDYEKAIKQIDFALKSDSSNSDYLLLKGNALDKLKRFQSAYDTYSLLIQTHPDNPVGLSQRGLLLNSIQQFEDAIQDFDKALSLDNTDSFKLTLYLNRGAVKINTRDFQGAYNDFILAYKIDSLDIGTLNNLASVCDEVGKGEKTLEYLYKIIKIDSTFIGTYVNIGFKYQEMGDYKAAIQFFDKVIKMDPKEPLSYSNRSYNKYKLGDLEGALADINKSISLYPTNSYAYRTRALIYISMKKNKNACADLEKAIDLGFTKMYGEEVQQLKLKNCK